MGLIWLGHVQIQYQSIHHIQLVSSLVCICDCMSPPFKKEVVNLFCCALFWNIVFLRLVLWGSLFPPKPPVRRPDMKLFGIILIKQILDLVRTLLPAVFQVYIHQHQDKAFLNANIMYNLPYTYCPFSIQGDDQL